MGINTPTHSPQKRGYNIGKRIGAGGGPFNSYSQGSSGPSGNPSGLTISGAKDLYANQLAEGATLQQAMASNPAETTYYGALVDDTQHDKGPQDMAFDVNKTYQELLGRDAGYSGGKYWTDQYNAAIKAGTSSEDAIANIHRDIKAGDEYKGLGSNNITITPSTGSDTNMGPSTNNVTISPSTGSDPNMGPYQEGDPNIGGGNNTITDSIMSVTPPVASSNWYDGYGSGAEWLADNPQGGTADTGDGKWDQFMEFMTALNGMGGMFGGGGGMGYGGYGGFNPGGVASASPYQGMMNFMNAFSGMGSSNKNSVTTQNTNV